MKHSRTLITIGLTVAVVGIAIWALAGSFTSSGSVYPSEGCTDETIFHYRISYALDPGEDPPDVYVKIFKGGEQVGGDRLLGIQQIGSIVVDYEYTTTLDEAGSDYSFKFWCLWDETTEQSGPDVEDC